MNEQERIDLVKQLIRLETTWAELAELVASVSRSIGNIDYNMQTANELLPALRSRPQRN
ncbi:MAG: hypothetical protein AB7N24_09940 [Dehalococcoidia bacterium]